VKLANLERTLGRYNSSLRYELQCLSIHEEILPPNDENIVHSLCRIGECYEELSVFNVAVNYYKRAFAVGEQYFPLGSTNRKELDDRIEKLSLMINLPE